MITINETGIGSVVENSVNIDHTRCDRLCLGIDSALNPINLKIKNWRGFINMSINDIIGTKMLLKYFTCYVFAIEVTPA